MKRLAILVMCLTVGMLGTEAVAGGPNVTVGNNFFDPDDVLLTAPGSSVTWDWAGGGFPHNVRQDDQIFRSGTPTSNGTATFQRVFSAGTFHYYCENHGFPTGGMDGVIRVRPLLDDGPAGLPFLVRWSTAATNTGDYFDVRYRIGDGQWRTWKTDTQQSHAKFGRNDNPIVVRPGRRYRFRVRSQAGPSTPPSGWSPVVGWRT